MASLRELKEIREDIVAETAALYPKLVGAVLVSVNNIRTEPGGTTNHTNRLIWAKQASADPSAKAKELAGAALSVNAGASRRAIEGANDAAVQTAVNVVINLFADGS